MKSYPQDSKIQFHTSSSSGAPSLAFGNPFADAVGSIHETRYLEHISNSRRIMGTLKPPSLLGVFDDVQFSNRRKRKHSDVLGAKTLLASMAMLCTLLNLYQGTVVVRKYNSGIESITSGRDRLVSAVSDLQLYPTEFQDLHWKRIENSPSVTEEQQDPRLWNSELRIRMHRKFQKHNRESIYSLFLLPQDDQDDEPNIDNALFWNGEELPYIHEYVRKRHKQGFYKFFDMVGRDFVTEEEAKA